MAVSVGEPDMANQGFIQNMIDRLTVIVPALREAFDAVLICFGNWVI
jgi:hypothetical protein